MRVRFLDWSEALEQPQVAAIQSQDSIIARQRASSEPSALEPGVQFEAIIGSDLIYEASIYSFPVRQVLHLIDTRNQLWRLTKSVVVRHMM